MSADVQFDPQRAVEEFRDDDRRAKVIEEGVAHAPISVTKLYSGDVADFSSYADFYANCEREAHEERLPWGWRPMQARQWIVADGNFPNLREAIREAVVAVGDRIPDPAGFRQGWVLVDQVIRGMKLERDHWRYCVIGRHEDHYVFLDFKGFAMEDDAQSGGRGGNAW